MEKSEKIIAIIAVVQLCKYYGVPSKLLPIFAIIVGAILEFSDNPTGNGVLDGILIGAVVAGSFGLAKGIGSLIFKRCRNLPEGSLNVDDIDKLEPDDDRVNF